MPRRIPVVRVGDRGFAEGERRIQPRFGSAAAIRYGGELATPRGYCLRCGSGHGYPPPTDARVTIPWKADFLRRVRPSPVSGPTNRPIYRTVLGSRRLVGYAFRTVPYDRRSRAENLNCYCTAQLERDLQPRTSVRGEPGPRDLFRCPPQGRQAPWGRQARLFTCCQARAYVYRAGAASYGRQGAGRRTSPAGMRTNDPTESHDRR